MSTHTSTSVKILSVTFEVGEIRPDGTFYAWDGYCSEYICTDPACRAALLARYGADDSTTYADTNPLVAPTTYYPLQSDGSGFRVLGVGDVDADAAADECDPITTCSVCGTLIYTETLEG